MVRKVALTFYTGFSNPREFEPVEFLEADEYVTEMGMGSHLIYELRNQGLETIEKVIGRTFQKSEKTGVLKDSRVVFWWSWDPFHKWKGSWWRKIKGG